MASALRLETDGFTISVGPGLRNKAERRSQLVSVRPAISLELIQLLESVREQHITPSGGRQAFQYCVGRITATNSCAA
jgi:hypothetical protein